MSEIQKMNLASENLVDDRLDKLKELMPEAFTEGGIDFDKLRLLLGDEVARVRSATRSRGLARSTPYASHRP